jgi:hypothetical protein
MKPCMLAAIARPIAAYNECGFSLGCGLGRCVDGRRMLALMRISGCPADQQQGGESQLMPGGWNAAFAVVRIANRVLFRDGSFLPSATGASVKVRA